MIIVLLFVTFATMGKRVKVEKNKVGCYIFAD